MKKSKCIYLFLCLLACACSKPLKNVKDYYPEIKTVSATLLPNGSVEVKGEVVSSGEAPIEYAGFCAANNSSTPKMMDRQLLADGSFTAIYDEFKYNEKCYFRAWATNEYGYVYGNVLMLDSIKPALLTFPCNLPNNSVNIGSGVTETFITTLEYDSTTTSLHASSNSVNMNLKFSRMPRTKNYKTTMNNTPNNDQIYLYFYSGLISGTLEDGSDVYVNQLDATHWELCICEANWKYNNTTLKYKTRFKFTVK